MIYLERRKFFVRYLSNWLRVGIPARIAILARTKGKVATRHSLKRGKFTSLGEDSAC
jgi:hypothetical protein